MRLMGRQVSSGPHRCSTSREEEQSEEKQPRRPSSPGQQTEPCGQLFCFQHSTVCSNVSAPRTCSGGDSSSLRSVANTGIGLWREAGEGGRLSRSSPVVVPSVASSEIEAFDRK